MKVELRRRHTPEIGATYAWGVGELGTIKQASKVLNSSEDAHIKSMRTFETDECLQVCRSAAPVACKPRVACGPVGLGGGVESVTGVGVTTGGSVRAVSFLGFSLSLAHDPPNRQQTRPQQVHWPVLQLEHDIGPMRHPNPRLPTFLNPR